MESVPVGRICNWFSGKSTDDVLAEANAERPKREYEMPACACVPDVLTPPSASIPRRGVSRVAMPAVSKKLVFREVWPVGEVNGTSVNADVEKIVVSLPSR